MNFLFGEAAPANNWPVPGGEEEQRKKLLGDVKNACQLLLASCPSVFSEDSGSETLILEQNTEGLGSHIKNLSYMSRHGGLCT